MPPTSPSTSLMRAPISISLPAAPPGQQRLCDKYVGAQLRLRLGSHVKRLRTEAWTRGLKSTSNSSLRTPYPHMHLHAAASSSSTSALRKSHSQPSQLLQTRVYQTSASLSSFHPPNSSASATPLSSSYSSTKRPSPTSQPSLISSPTLQHRPTRLRPTWLSGIMASATQTRGHGGHGHHHHHDNTYLTSQNKNDAGVRITRIGLYANLGMAVSKFIGGYVFNSQSMIADAWHSMTDLASDILTLATVSFSLRPPSDTYPWGFGKVESLGSLGVSGMLLGGGVFMGMSSLESLYAHFFLDPAAAAELLHHGHSHGHSHGAVGPSIHAAWLAAGTVLIKEWLYHATMKVAKERKSAVLASNAIHHRVDSWTGIVTMIVILAANFLKNAAWLDPVGGLLISFLVIKGGWGNTIASLYELADRTIDDEVKASVRRQALKSLETVSQGHEVELREVSGIKSGQNYLVDVELAVPGGWTVEDVRDVETAVRTQLGAKVRGVRKVRVRFVGKEQAGEMAKFDEFISSSVSPQSSPEPEEHNHEHNQEHEHGNGKKHN